MAKAKSELSEAKKSAEELALRVVESRVRARATRKEISRLKNSASSDEEWTLVNGGGENHQVIAELEIARQELSNMRIEVASAMKMKKKEEEETKVLEQRMEKHLKSIEELENEVEKANEEHVIVELARIEASKEYREIEARRKVEAARFSHKMKEAKARRKNLIKEVNHAEELEMKLAITTSDLDVLQNEMVLVRAMGKNLKASKNGSPNKKMQEMDMENMDSLQTAKNELKTARKELTSVKEEGFRFMSAMDVVREEMLRISNEVFRMKKSEEKTDMTVQNLNSKLRRAKSKLKDETITEKKSKEMVTNLSTSVERMQRDKEEAEKKYKQKATERESLRSEIDKNEFNVHGLKEDFLAAMQELEALKASEAVTLERLKILSEKTRRRRASPMPGKTTITVSKLEYDYLSKCAKGAQELADTKVAAAQAWIAALKASEKEILMQSDIVRNEMQAMKELEKKKIDKLDEEFMTIEEDQQKGKHDRGSHAAKSPSKLRPPRISSTETGADTMSRRSKTRRKSTTPGKTFTSEIGMHLIDPEAAPVHIVESTPRKSFKGNAATPSRRSHARRRSSSSGVRVLVGPPSTVSRTRKKVMPNLAKFFRARKAAKQKLDN